MRARNSRRRYPRVVGRPNYQHRASFRFSVLRLLIYPHVRPKWATSRPRLEVKVATPHQPGLRERKGPPWEFKAEIAPAQVARDPFLRFGQPPRGGAADGPGAAAACRRRLPWPGLGGPEGPVGARGPAGSGRGIQKGAGSYITEEPANSELHSWAPQYPHKRSIAQVVVE